MLKCKVITFNIHGIQLLPVKVDKLKEKEYHNFVFNYSSFLLATSFVMHERNN